MNCEPDHRYGTRQQADHRTGWDTDDVVAQFRDAIRAAGLQPPPEVVPDGTIHLFPSEGRPGDMTAAMDKKQAILDHFGDDFTPFYRHYFPDMQPKKGKAMVLCFLHDDRKHPNLDLIFKDSEKRGYWHCHACKVGGDIFKFYAMKKGLDCKTQFRQVLDGIVSDFGIRIDDGQVQREIVAAHDYTDEAGDLLYQEVRWEPGKNGKKKDFSIRRSDGNGGWIWNGDGIRAVPYRLHELIRPRGDGPVVITEGPAKADVYWGFGIRATTNHGGARKWSDAHAQHLADEDIILQPDKDDAGLRHMNNVGASLKTTARSIRWAAPPAEFPHKGDIVNAVRTLGWQQTNIEQFLEDAKPWEPNGNPDDHQDDTDDGQKAEAETQASKLVGLASENAKLFHDQYDSPYARIYILGHREILRCKSQHFRRWLTRQYYEEEGKVPGSETFKSALNVIEAKALYDGEQHKLYNRVAQTGDSYWYDMSDSACRTIEVTAEGWELVTDSPILFNRYDHQSPQVEPVAGGDIKKLFDVVLIENEDTQLLILAWLITCLVPDIPHPIPVLHGPQGSGKSSDCRMLRRLIDPSELQTLSFSGNRDELVQNLAHHYLPMFDNIDTLSAWQSNMLCRASTGEAVSKRVLFTDDDDFLYHFRRCVGLNGINVSATRADLLDRCILIPLDRISPEARREEEELEQAFEEARSEIVGGILDAFSRAIAIRPSVNLQSLPRMADFARWGCAVALALGQKAEDFERAYAANIKIQNAEVLEGNPVAAAVRALMENRADWEGEPARLLTELEEVAVAEKINVKDKAWPGAPNWLTRRLNEVKPNLADAGIMVDTGRHEGERRTIRIRKEDVVNAVMSSDTLGENGLSLDVTDDATPDAEGISSDGNALRDSSTDATDGIDATGEESGGW